MFFLKQYFFFTNCKQTAVWTRSEAAWLRLSAREVGRPAARARAARPPAAYLSGGRPLSEKRVLTPCPKTYLSREPRTWIDQDPTGVFAGSNQLQFVLKTLLTLSLPRKSWALPIS